MITASPLRHSTSLKGPVPFSWVAMPSAPTFSSNFFWITSWNGSIAGSSGQGDFSTKRTVLSSTFSTFSSGPSRLLRGLVLPSMALSPISRLKV